jgi:hypothetical protein
MEYSFPRYLLAKQTVDDRAINRPVLERLRSGLEVLRQERSGSLRSIEVGAGIGTMLKRLLDWGLISQGEYILLDQSGENINFAREWLPNALSEGGLKADWFDQSDLQISGNACDLAVRFAEGDLHDFPATNPPKADLLIAHALLDLLPMPDSLVRLFSLVRPGGLAWLTLNFDGVTALEPAIDPALDQLIERLYHESMDRRETGGDSRSGRHLFGHLQRAGGRILAAGSSDWVIYPDGGSYQAQEAYFLYFIIHFFEQSLSGHPQLDPKTFRSWLSRRREQIKQGELVYITHQMDFLVAV